TVIVDNAIDGGFDVDVSTADGTATTANSDYTAVTAQTLTFAGTAGETETFTITPTADATSEPDETVII
ncbi:Calx-beta domain-containing protein, partial [Aquimarina algiphila]